MITIIAGTNRPASRTFLIAENYSKNLTAKNISHKILNLEDLPPNFLHSEMYNDDGLSDEMISIQEEYILPSTKIVVIVPEYNGGMPGIFKLFIDAMCARKYKENFSGKKISLVGVSAGRAGNLRGLESLTGILNYLGAIVLPNKLPLSSINNFIGEDDSINNDLAVVIDEHIDQFLEF